MLKISTDLCDTLDELHTERGTGAVYDLIVCGVKSLCLRWFRFCGCLCPKTNSSVPVRYLLDRYHRLYQSHGDVGMLLLRQETLV